VIDEELIEEAHGERIAEPIKRRKGEADVIFRLSEFHDSSIRPAYYFFPITRTQY